MRKSAGFSALLFYGCAFGRDNLYSGDLTTTESTAVRSKKVVLLLCFRSASTVCSKEVVLLLLIHCIVFYCSHCMWELCKVLVS